MIAKVSSAPSCSGGDVWFRSKWRRAIGLATDGIYAGLSGSVTTAGAAGWVISEAVLAALDR